MRDKFSEIAADAFFEMCGYIDGIIHPDSEFFHDEESDASKLQRIDSALKRYKEKVRIEREKLEV